MSVDDSIVQSPPISIGEFVYDTSTGNLLIGVGTDTIGDWNVLATTGHPYHFIIDSILTKIEDWIGTGAKTFVTCYDTALDGRSSSAFHSACDNLGATVTVIRMEDGTTLGGYNSNSWSSSSNYTYSSTNFLFSISDNQKYPVKSGYPGAYNRSNYGPTFGGGHDIHIRQDMKTGYCYPYSYTGQSQNDFCGSYSSWSIDRLVVLTVQ